MQTLPAGVIGPLSSTGGCAAISLVEVLTASGNKYFWSEQRGWWNSVINGSTGILIEPVGATAGGSSAAYSNASGAITWNESRPLAFGYETVLWSDFAIGASSQQLPLDAVIQGIYPVFVGSAVFAAVTTMGFRSGTALPISGSLPVGGLFTSPSNPDNTSFTNALFYGASIGNTLAALTGQQIEALTECSLSLGPPLTDSVTVTAVGFAIYYTSASPIIDGQMPAPFAVPAGQGLSWALPFVVDVTGLTGAQGTAAGTIAVALVAPVPPSPVFVEYLDWLVKTQHFQLFGSTQTDTATLSVQNLSGNTVERDVALAYAKNEFIGAFVYYRLWRADAECAIFQFAGNVVDADIDEEVMELTLEGFGNYSAIRAPAYAIDVACPLFFGSIACGSTSPTPCQQSYGTCTSIERFAGALVQWDFSDGVTPLVQIAQPPPVAAANLARPF